MARTVRKPAIDAIKELPDREDFLAFAAANPTAGDPDREGHPAVIDAEAGAERPEARAVRLAGPARTSDRYPDEARSLYTPHEFSFEEWAEWFAAQSLGTLPFNAVVCHHTYRPSQDQWIGMQHVHNLRAYYRDTYGWPDGRMPHMFITDGRGSFKPGNPRIFTATHPAHDGIHAVNGNGRTKGIEAVHDGEATPFTDAMMDLYERILGVLARRRGGKVFESRTWLHNPASWNGIRVHRTIPGNTSVCYGTRNMSVERFYDRVKGGGAPEPPKPQPTADDHLFDTDYGVTEDMALRYVLSRGAHEQRARAAIAAIYSVEQPQTTWAPAVRAAQSFHETGGWNYGHDSRWANMAGIKKGGDVGDEPRDFLVPATAELGAHIQAQHARAYSGKPHLKPVHARYFDAYAAQKARGWWVTRVSQLGGGIWATDELYASHLMDVIRGMQKA